MVVTVVLGKTEYLDLDLKRTWKWASLPTFSTFVPFRDSSPLIRCECQGVAPL